MTHIFSLLAAYDLYSASLTNKFFSTTINDYESDDISASRYKAAKVTYSIRLQQRHDRQGHIVTRVRSLSLETRRSYLKFFLDITLTRSVSPLSLMLLLLSLLFFVLHADGFNLPLWACATPPALSILYFMGIFALTSVVRAQVSFMRPSIHQPMSNLLTYPVGMSRCLTRTAFFMGCGKT